MSAAPAGTTVLDLSRALAGPHAAMVLADQGARVTKVESPGTGDDARSWGPPFAVPDGVIDGPKPPHVRTWACGACQSTHPATGT
ncbi:CoA transferase [Allosalinactinospora lopnorensis]|uniref:CoA transferase n=1 Tax=Allosalinactinospora lopnorensis TaxID=1352348 RepID=UPI000623F69C